MKYWLRGGFQAVLLIQNTQKPAAGVDPGAGFYWMAPKTRTESALVDDYLIAVDQGCQGVPGIGTGRNARQLIEGGVLQHDRLIHLTVPLGADVQLHIAITGFTRTDMIVQQVIQTAAGDVSITINLIALALEQIAQVEDIALIGTEVGDQINCRAGSRAGIIRLPDESIGTCSTAESVVAFTTLDDVIALLTIDDIVAFTTDQNVVAALTWALVGIQRLGAIS